MPQLSFRSHVSRFSRLVRMPALSRALKSLFPKGLRGRTVMILLFPVIMTQLVIAGVFIQRHHDRVTRQMVANIEPHIRLVLSRISSAPNIDEAVDLITPIIVPGKLQVSISPESGGPETDRRLFYDFSGAIVIDTLKQAIPSVKTVDLLPENGNLLIIRANTTLGEAKIFVSRSSVSPSNPHQLLVLMVVTGILLTAIAYVFLRNQLRPIIRLANASKAFGTGEHIELAPAGATEVREATQAFLDMRERIETHLEQRTQMLSSISHDLKTPLARLRVGLELLGPSRETDELIADVNHMNLMVQEFVEYSQHQRLESVVEVDAVSLTDDICRDAHVPGRTLSLVIDQNVQGGVSANIRPISTRRAVQNLVQNAFNHAKSVRLTVTLRGGMLCFIVEDDGPGIPEESRELALRPFTRLDSARSLSHVSGVGLGLAIAEDISASQGGTLELGDSADLGGLMAVIALPVSESAAPQNGNDTD